MQKIRENIKVLTQEMEYPKPGHMGSYEAVRKYNAYILGVHQYYLSLIHI